jgi:hypothetical protein
MPKPTTKEYLRKAPSLANVMYPSLSPKVKAQNEEAQRRRDKLLRDLRELNGRLRGK